ESDLAEIEKMDLFDSVSLTDSSVRSKLEYRYSFAIDIPDYVSYVPWIANRVSVENARTLYPGRVSEFFTEHEEWGRGILSRYLGKKGWKMFKYQTGKNWEILSINCLPNLSELLGNSPRASIHFYLITKSKLLIQFEQSSVVLHKRHFQ
ncbi:hypothetical protein NKF06_20755, partial [Haloferax sp. AB510]|uniref:hypothetical protein n=1 Tax=Haloferax sp. AB510 TaxID=2934172 RepID=UPI00209BFA6F